MKKLLYVIANPNPAAQSFSKKAGQIFLDAYQKNHPEDKIVIKDLYQEGVPLLDEDYFHALSKISAGKNNELSAGEQAIMQKVGAQVDQFLTFDNMFL